MGVLPFCFGTFWLPHSVYLCEKCIITFWIELKREKSFDSSSIHSMSWAMFCWTKHAIEMALSPESEDLLKKQLFFKGTCCKNHLPNECIKSRTITWSKDSDTELSGKWALLSTHCMLSQHCSCSKRLACKEFCPFLRVCQSGQGKQADWK